MSKGGFDNTVGGWERLLAAVRENEQIFATGEPLWAALAFYLEEAKEAKERQRLHMAEKQQATVELDQRLAAGSDAAIRLKNHVKSHLGIHDERLPQFGIKPIRVRKGSSSWPELIPPSDAEGQEQLK